MLKPQIFCALDLEGTGLDPRKDAIIEAGAVLFELTKSDELVFHESFSQLVRPPIPVSPFIQELTGITQRQLEDQPMWEQVRPEFAKFVGKHIIVGQNVGFDLAFLAAGGITFTQGFIDTREVGRTFLPDAKFSNLEYLMQYLGRPLTSHHRAGDDAKSAAILLLEILRSFHRLDYRLQTRASDLLHGSGLLYKNLFQPKRIRPTAKKSVRASESLQQELFAFSPVPGLKIPSLQPLFEQPGGFFADLPISLLNQATLQALIREGTGRKGSLAISLANSSELSEVRQPLPAGSWQILRESEEYLCEVRLQELLAAPPRSDTLVQFLVRVLLWQQTRTEPEMLGELTLVGEEFSFRDLICGSCALCGEHECAFSAALKTLDDRARVLTTHAAWLAYTESQQPVRFERALFWNIGALGDAMAKRATRIVSLLRLRRLLTTLRALASFEDEPTILDALDLYFGVLNIAAQHLLEQAGTTAVEASTRQSQFFRQMELASRNFIDRLLKLLEHLPGTPESPVIAPARAKLEGIIQFLEEFFFAPHADTAYCLEYFAGELKLRAYVHSTPLFRKIRPKAYGLLGPAYPSAVSEYWRRRLQLDDLPTLTLAGPRPSLRLLIPEEQFGRQKLADHTAVARLLEGRLRAVSGRTLVVCNSQKYLEDLYGAIADPEMRARLITQRLSGPPWKNLEQYAKDENAIWLVSGGQLLKLRQTLPAADRVVIARLPYEGSGACENLTNTDNVFTDVVLPRTIVRIVELLSRALSLEGGTLIFLDTRIAASYNRPILQAISLHFEIQQHLLTANPEGW